MPLHTDSAGLEAGFVRIPAGDREIPAYRAMPAKTGPAPVILVVQEIFGVHDYLQDVCRRLAHLGYFALAPDLYIRQGDVSKLTDHQEIQKIVAQVPDAQVMSDLDAAVAWAGAHADTARLGLTGFCWGGRIAWLYAAHSAQLKAAVAWYGKLAPPATQLQPKRPIDIAADLRCPVLGLYGGQDQSIPLEQVSQMRSRFHDAHKNATIVVYPHAGHGFHADYRPLYDRSAAEDGWQRLREWFQEYVYNPSI